VRRHRGFNALRIKAVAVEAPPNDKLYYPLFVKCVELSIPFCTQTGRLVAWRFVWKQRPIPYLGRGGAHVSRQTLVIALYLATPDR
jgi:hypothetical protein